MTQSLCPSHTRRHFGSGHQERAPSAPRAALANLFGTMVWGWGFFCGSRNVVPPEWRVKAGLCGVACAVPPVPPRHDGPTLEEPLTVAEPETPPEALEEVGVPPGHPAGEPQCVCCFYRTSLRIDEDLRTPGWRWSSCPSQLEFAPQGWVEGWVWHHGNSPHAPYQFRHQRTGAQPHMNAWLGPHGRTSGGVVGPSLALQPGGPPRNQAQALRDEMYDRAEANDLAMARYLDEVRRRRNEALPQEAPRTLPPSDIGDITAALPSAPPQEALQALAVPQDDAGRLLYLAQVTQVDQMLANAHANGRFLWPSQAIEAVIAAAGLEARGPLTDLLAPGPPSGEENLQGIQEDF